MTKLKLDLVCQVAVVVPDLEKGLEQVRTLFGIDESSVSFGESLEPPGQLFHGRHGY